MQCMLVWVGITSLGNTSAKFQVNWTKISKNTARPMSQIGINIIPLLN